MKILLTLLLATASCFGTAFNVTGSGNWSSSATFGGLGVPGVGDTVSCAGAFTVTVDVNTTLGTSPASGNVLTQSSGCTIALAQNVTFTLLGGFSKGGTVRRASGSKILFDSTGAASPTATPYTLSGSGTWTDDATNPPTWTAGNFFTITANPAGTNWRWANSTAGSGITGMGAAVISYCGDPGGAALCLPYTPGGSGILAFGGMTKPVIFDHTCGVKWGTGTTVNDGWNFVRVSFENTYPLCPPWYSQTGSQVPAGGVPRIFDTVMFDSKPQMETHGALYTNSLFLKGYLDLNLFVGYGTISNSVIVESFQSATTPLVWNDSDNVLGINNFILTNDTVLGDPTTTFPAGVPTKQSPYTSGTATSASNSTFSGTLTDSTKAWTAHAYQSATIPGTYMLTITAGTGAGQSRPIYDNTSTTLTVVEAWDTLPDATSTYAIYDGIFNSHWTNGTSLVAGQSETYSGNNFGLDTGVDNQGDIFHSLNAVPSATCNLWRGPWVSGTAYAAFSGVSESGVYYRSTVATTGNDPATDGGAHWTVSTLLGLNSGCGVYQLDYNIMRPNAARDDSGTFITAGNAAYKFHHNTYGTMTQSLAFDESRPGAFPSGLLEVQDNLGWAEPGKKYVFTGGGLSQSSGGPFLIRDSGSGGSGSAYNIDSAAVADYNGGYGLRTDGYCASVTGSNEGGSGAYDAVCTHPYGLHDVTGDPGFVDRWASPQKWIQSLGYDASSVDPVEIMPNVYACMMKMNDVSGFDARCSVSGLYSYLHNAFAPTNVAFHNTASDGTDIGAVTYAGGLTLSSIAISPTSPSLTVGSTQTFTAICTWSDTLVHPCPTLTWNSATTSVATINSSTGVATAIASGTSNITATASSITSNTAVLTVTAVTLSSIALTPNPIVIYQGYPVQLTATCTYSDSSTANCTSAITTWTSTNTSLATVNSTGLVTSFTGTVTPGFGGITASLGSVTSPSAPLAIWLLSNITLAPSLPRFLLIGNSQTYVATCQFSDATTRNCTPQVGFNSSNTGAVTVAGATATAVGTGSSNITAAFIGRTSPASVINVITRGHTGFARGTGLGTGTRIQ